MDSTTRNSRPEDAQQSELAFQDQVGAPEPEGVEPRVTDPNVSFPAEPIAGMSGVAPQAPAETPAVPLWAQRLQLIIFVVFCVQLGLLLTILPWKPVWTENSLVLSLPSVRAVLQHNFVRGLVTGLGLVDIWLGVWEAVHYREKR